ncbi:MAG: transcription-repair coupling factor [Deltaproteobacteria bacterium]|nr:transcription-repair coupling factor [Deltaproteobacteria bacterium]
MARLAALLTALESGRGAQALHGLQGSATAYLLAQLRLRHATQPLFIITDTIETAETCSVDLAYFSGPAIHRPLLLPPRGLPYQSVPTAAEVETTRLATLRTLQAWGRQRDPDTAAPVVVTPIAACLQVLPPAALMATYLRELARGQPIDREGLLCWLTEAGYANALLVEDVGTFAARGCLVDCWPPGLPSPCRIELDGDSVNGLRLFDPETQCSHAHLDHVLLGPGDEILYTDELRRRALRELRARADTADIPVPQRRLLSDPLQAGHRTPLLEGLLPLFYETVSDLAAYLPPATRIVWIDSVAIATAARQYRDQVTQLAMESEPIVRTVRPDELTTPLEDFQSRVAAHPQCSCEPAPGETTTTWSTTAIAALQLRHRAAAGDTEPFTGMATLLREIQQSCRRTTIVCHTGLAAERTIDLLRWHGVSAVSSGHMTEEAHTIRVEIGTLSAGFVAPDDGLAYFTEEELFGRKIRKAPVRRRTTSAPFVSFQDLAAGDYIVHEQHGVGRYHGLTQMDLPATPHGKPIRGDFVQLEYLGEAKLYLPVYRLHLLQRYIGSDDAAPLLDRLGGTRWSTAKKRALQSIRTMAHELLKIYAARQVHAGFAFSGRDHLLEEFESHFPYDETPDQWQAIEDTLRDMQAEKPMDRLVCGDVGYGKTEVALRAAFRAATDGKQVALVCPTTLLAFQHFQTFTTRFAHLPVRLELLNRFRSAAEQAEVVKAVAAGTVDIVIGTHRLLQRDIKVPRLGLLILDEEQRFGVAHKERLRKLRSTVDTLTLTATPIPRTLHMALAGLRDISIIQTPPADRRAVRTHVTPFNEATIREAIRIELRRDGQVFFVHNRVQTIQSMRDQLTRLLPEARFVVAHGQMAEEELEQAMRAFLAKEADILLCTSIIEAGLDIPAANTLIVNRADTFGLAQLYQLRGRVGRSNLQATAYFLTPATDDGEAAVRTTPQAERRLATLARYTELGSGFTIAMHDLEMRGSGNMLGAQQSGHIAEIGYELFTRLLERTIRQLQGEPDTESVDPEIALPLPALLPATYLDDPGLRLAWYKRLSGTTTEEELQQIEAELRDRFGPLPEEAQHLFHVIALRQTCAQLGIEQLQCNGEIWRIKFHPQTRVAPECVLRLVNREPKRYQLKPDNILLVRAPATTAVEILRAGREILQRLIPSAPLSGAPGRHRD